MIATELIDAGILPLKLNDTVEVALHLMQDAGVEALPVVEDKKLLGTIRYSDIAEENSKQKIQQFISMNSIPAAFYNMHILQLLPVFASQKSTICTVVSQEEEYLGVIKLIDLMSAPEIQGINMPGAIFSILIQPNDYSLSDLSRLVEGNDAKIIYLSLSQAANQPGSLLLTMKLNITHVNKVLSALERFKYQVLSVYNAEPTHDDIESKYKYLIHYLHF
jgi:CBS domain-containing protein